MGYITERGDRHIGKRVRESTSERGNLMATILDKRRKSGNMNSDPETNSGSRSGANFRRVFKLLH